MAISSSQLTTIKNHINANTNTIDFGGILTQIKDLPNNLDANFEIAAWYNQLVSPDYWVWRSSVSRSDIYNTINDVGSAWDWTVYKNQSVGEQNAWVQIFMGDIANFGQLNMRVGISKIFTGSAQANAQRDFCLSIGRRSVKQIEKLLAVAILNPPSNTGNDGISGNRGKTTNPDLLSFEGNISAQQITDARNS